MEEPKQKTNIMGTLVIEASDVQPGKRPTLDRKTLEKFCNTNKLDLQLVTSKSKKGVPYYTSYNPIHIDIREGVYLPDNCYGLFKNVLGKVDIYPSIDTSNVTTMTSMFENTPLANPNVSRWDVSNVRRFDAMFAVALSANPDEANWNLHHEGPTENYDDFVALSQMFNSMNADPDVSRWNTSYVRSTAGMFGNNKKANPDVSKWNTAHLEEMGSMFTKAEQAQPDLSKWNAPQLFTFENAFWGSDLKTLYALDQEGNIAPFTAHASAHWDKKMNSGYPDEKEAAVYIYTFDVRTFMEAKSFEFAYFAYENNRAIDPRAIDIYPILMKNENNELVKAKMEHDSKLSRTRRKTTVDTVLPAGEYYIIRPITGPLSFEMKQNEREVPGTAITGLTPTMQGIVVKAVPVIDEADGVPEIGTKEREVKHYFPGGAWIKLNTKATVTDPAPLVGPVAADTPNPIPDKYAKITIGVDAEKANPLEKNTYYVLKDAKLTLADIVNGDNKPVIQPKEGWAFKGWDKAPETALTGDLTVNALFERTRDTHRQRNVAAAHGSWGGSPAVHVPNRLVFTIGEKAYEITGHGEKPMDVVPYIENGRTMIPIRYAAEALGMKVDWNAQDRTVTFSNDTHQAKLTVGELTIYVNATSYQADVAPVIRNDRTFVSISNLGRALGPRQGQEIKWDAAKRTVTIDNVR